MRNGTNPATICPYCDRKVADSDPLVRFNNRIYHESCFLLFYPNRKTKNSGYRLGIGQVIVGSYARCIGSVISDAEALMRQNPKVRIEDLTMWDQRTKQFRSLLSVCAVQGV